MAQALNWATVLLVTAQRLTNAVLRDLVADGQGDELAIQQRIFEFLEETIRLARGLSSRAASLWAIAPKLRAKGSDAAVADDPAHNDSIPMTDRAARRFCDRLVELGVAWELTGRLTFRLYGIVR